MFNRAVMRGKGWGQGWLSLVIALVLVLSIGLVVVETAEAADETYVVKRGDNLTSIAARYGVTVSSIAKANDILNVNNIFGGQKLTIPNANGSNSNNSPTPPTTNEQAYIVQRGDNLSTIAARFNVTLLELASANKISVMNYIYAGQSLRIPGKVASALAATTPASETVNPAPTVIVAPTFTPIPPTATPAPATATPIPPTATPIIASDTAAPASTATAVAASAVAPAPPSSTVSSGTYTVQSGDNLSSIATRFNTTVEAIQRANNIVNPSLIFSGQVLTIPGASGAVAPQPKATAVAAQPVPPSVINTDTSGKWIDVNLSKQRLTAYDGKTAVFSTLVSTGVSNHPTVTGTFNIYVKYGSQAMSGGSGREYYYLPGVPYVMYFYSNYAIHGTYWHNNFGRPMSHGCVNLPTPAAKFMYGWASIGTPVKVHY